QRAQPRQDGRANGPERRARHTAAGQLGIGGKTIYLRLVQQQVERIETAEHLLIRAIQLGLDLALSLELVHARLRLLAQLVELAEANRLSGAGLRAGRLHALLEAVITQRTLLGHQLVGILAHMNDPEGTRRHAVAAAIA